MVSFFLRRARPDAELTCICAYVPGASEKVSADFGIKAVPLAVPKLGWLAEGTRYALVEGAATAGQSIRAISYASKLDVLIAPGTGMRRFHGPADWNASRILRMVLGRQAMRGKDRARQCGAGPIQHPISRWLMKSAAGMAQYRSYRDAKSKAFMESIGSETREDSVYPDLVLSCPCPHCPSGRLLTVSGSPSELVSWHTVATGRIDGEAIYVTYPRR